jgi:lathosterol oxidase
MLCEVSIHLSFVTTWALLTFLGGLSIFGLSGSVFWAYYWKPTYEKWVMKTNPTFPPVEKVRLEIIQTTKSLMAATLVPALTLWLAARGKSQAYCGLGPEAGYLGLSPSAWLVAQFFVFWVISDFFEFFYHNLGHSVPWLWGVHRHHHVFFNPTPFAVIADEAADQLVRTAPLLLIPLLMPTNMDLLFVQFTVFFYGYGVYLHWGFESTLISPHNAFVNTAYEHYYHHAVSGGATPLYTGFFFKLWDQLAGTVSQKPCVCARCEAAKGKRSRAEWEKVEKPDYAPLLSPAFWAGAFSSKAEAAKAA